jgi:hypothetical protein
LQVKRFTKELPMQNHAARTSLLPSALVLCDLLNAHAGDPPIEAFEQAGFRRHDVSRYLQQRAGSSRCSGTASSGSGRRSA